MSNTTEEKYTTLPIRLPYKDKIELVQKFLKVYSELVKSLTKRNIDLLTICLIEDMNSENFKELVLDSRVGINSDGQFRTEMTRLKDKGLIYPDKLILKKKHLKDELKQFAAVLRSKEKIALYIGFDLAK